MVKIISKNGTDEICSIYFVLLVTKTQNNESKILIKHQKSIMED